MKALLIVIVRSSYWMEIELGIHAKRNMTPLGLGIGLCRFYSIYLCVSHLKGMAINANEVVRNVYITHVHA